METHSFHYGAPPAGFSLDFEPSLFNKPGFLALQSAVLPVSLHLLHTRRRKSVAAVHFFVEDDIAKSPVRAPFGSIEFSPALNPRILFDFIKDVGEHLIEAGVREIFIKNPPRSYSPTNVALLETVLINHGYTVADAEVGATITLSEKQFTDIIRNSESLRLRQAVGAGLRSRKVRAEEAARIYRFISECYASKGHRISISLDQFQKTVRQFPDEYPLFEVVDGEEKMAAASVSVRVYQHILYNFMVGQDKKYDHLSPSLMLMQAAFDYCVASEIRLFDLGTSALENKPNFPLLDFKLHAGGEPTSKFSFYKKIG